MPATNAIVQPVAGGNPSQPGGGGYTGIIDSLIGNVGQAPNQNLSGLFGHSPVVNAFQQMMNQANQANSARGADILRLLQGAGTTQMQANATNEKQQEAQIQQQMMEKGLANTSVGNNLTQEAQNQLAFNNQQVSEKSAMDMAQMANSFTQQAPSMDLLASLVARGGGGGGGFDPNAGRVSGLRTGTPIGIGMLG